MKRKIDAQVSPKTAAVVILTLLVIVQYFWWHGLVARTSGGSSGKGGPMGPGGAGPLVLAGRKEVLVETLAGAIEPGDTDGVGRDARFDTPIQLTIDAQGNLYVADCRNHRIRRIAPNGATTTLAGSTPGDTDGPVATARFNFPCGVALGPDGSLSVADTGNHRIRRIKDGQVTTIAGSVAGMAEGQGSEVRFNLPVAVGVSDIRPGAPTLMVADAANRKVRMLDSSGKTSGASQTADTPVGIFPGRPTVVTASALLLSEGAGWKAQRDLPIDLQGKEGKQADFLMRRPLAVCSAPGGWFAVDAEQSCIFYLHGGKADLIAGRCQGSVRHSGWRDGNGETALFGRLGGLVTDGHGHLYVCDAGNNMIRRLTLPKDLQ